MYNDLIKGRKMHSLNTPQTIVPSPNDMDYENGSINRYFTQKTNDINGFVYEINLQTYNELLINPYWKVGIIKWRLSGPINIVYTQDGKIKDKGVRESNKSSIVEGEKIIKNLGLYLPNILQFYK